MKIRCFFGVIYLDIKSWLFCWLFSRHKLLQSHRKKGFHRNGYNTSTHKYFFLSQGRLGGIFYYMVLYI